jgi:hypothetical protein
MNWIIAPHDHHHADRIHVVLCSDVIPLQFGFTHWFFCQRYTADEEDHILS